MRARLILLLLALVCIVVGAITAMTTEQARMIYTPAGARIVFVLPRPDASFRVWVDHCQDPGRFWCYGQTYALRRWLPDGHCRDDGTLVESTEMMRAW